MYIYKYITYMYIYVYIYNIYIYIYMYILMRLVFQKHQNIIIYITFTWCINQFPLVNTFFFLFPQTFLLINFIIAQLQLISFFISDQLHHYLSTRFPLFRDLNLLTAFIFFLCLWLNCCRFLDAVNVDYCV